MSKPACRELLEQVRDEVVLPQQTLADRVEKVLALAEEALDKNGDARPGYDDEFAWAMTQVLRILDGEEP